MADGKTLLEQGLAHAQRIALLPPSARGALIAVVDGSTVRAGVVTRAGDHWTLATEIDVDLSTKQLTGRVTIIGQW